MLPTTFCSSSNDSDCSSSYHVPVLKHVYIHAFCSRKKTSSSPIFRNQLAVSFRVDTSHCKPFSPTFLHKKNTKLLLIHGTTVYLLYPLIPQKHQVFMYRYKHHSHGSVAGYGKILHVFRNIQGPGGGKFPTLVEEVCVFFKMVEINLPPSC